MSASVHAEARTRMFARVLGPYLVAITITALARASEMRSLLSQFDAGPVWPWLTGAFVLLGGLVVVALHQYWRGAAAIIVSVVGWMTILKGVFLIAFPHPYLSIAGSAVNTGTWWRAGFVVIALVGLYLTYVGWAPTSGRPMPRPASSSPDLPRAA
jgi:hypothetical protein